MDSSIKHFRNAMMGIIIIMTAVVKTVRLKRITTVISILITWEL